MAKKKVVVAKKPASICGYPHGNGCYALMGLVLVALGVVLYLRLWDLEMVVSVVLVLVGLKKILIAAKCC